MQKIEETRNLSNKGYKFTHLLVSASWLALAACGGGGGGAVGSSGSVTPDTSVVIAPVPVPVNPTPIALPSQGEIYTAEYRNSSYLAQIRADGAYLKGATGNGIKVAVIDGGTVAADHELAGKIILRIDTTGSNPNGGASTHGTAVSSIIAANRDNSGVMGVAYNAQLYDINVFQPGRDGPFAYDSNVARAINIASGVDPSYSGVDARVINMSLGGTSGFEPSVVTALKTAAGRDKVIVIAAGNDGAAEPDASARVAADPSLSPNMVIVGAVDANNNMASFSNRAGGYGEYYLVAPGVNLPTTSPTGAAVAFSGTSAAAPVVSGAFAVLAEAFPYLSGRELILLLKTTATDLGAAGVDAVYGYGLINLAAAMGPVGEMDVPTGSDVSGPSNPLDSVFITTGNVLGIVTEGVMVAFDSFNRPYDVGTSAIAGRSAKGSLFDRSGIGGATVGTGVGSLLASWQAPRGAQLALTAGNGVVGTSGTYAVALTDNVIGVMFRNARPSQLMAMQGFDAATDQGQPLFAVTADNALPQAGFFQQGLSAVAYGFRGDGYVASVAYGTGQNMQASQSSFMQASLAFEAAGVEWGFATSLLNEDNTVMGAYTSGSKLKGAYGRTVYTTLTASYPVEDWRMDLAFTRATIARGALATGFALKGVAAEAMSFTVSGPAGLREGDLLGFRMGQPLRASQGSVETYLPVGRSFAGEVIRAPQRLAIRPDGREIDLEVGYATPIPELKLGQRADLRLNAFYVRQPGNMQNAPDALGGAVQFTLEW